MPKPTKKPHWTQLPENRAKVRASRKKAAASRNKKYMARERAALSVYPKMVPPTVNVPGGDVPVTLRTAEKPAPALDCSLLDVAIKPLDSKPKLARELLEEFRRQLADPIGQALANLLERRPSPEV